MATTTLPSSPPQLTRSGSRSRSSSNYSLDLDALMPSDGSSELMTPLRKARIDVVHSEDIDGPTDFTQNLEYWMTAKLPNVMRPSHILGQARDDLEEYVSDESRKDSPKPAAEEMKKDSLMDTETPRRDGDGMIFLSNLTSSLHETEADSSTPRTVEHAPVQKEFQASVEDHEDTPSKVRESSSAIGAMLRSPHFTLKSRPAGYEGHHEESEIVKTLQETLVKLREELDEVRIHSQGELKRTKESYDWDAKKQATTYEENLQDQERVWQRRLATTKAEFHRQRASARDVESEVVKSDEEVQNLRRRLATQSSRIEELEEINQRHAQELEHANQEIGHLERDLHTTDKKHQLAMEDHTKERHDLEERYKALRERYERLETSKLDADDKNESLDAELANLKLEHAREFDEMTTRIEDAANFTQRAVLQEKKASQTAIAELEYENARLHTHLDTKDDEIDALKQDLHQLRQKASALNTEKDNLATKLKEQKTLNDQAAREIQSLRSGTKILQSQLTEVSATHSSAIGTLEQQLSDANASRLEADAEVDAAKAEAATAKSLAESAQAQLARSKDEYVLVNSAVDKRMRDVMKAREAEWTRRIELLKKEMGFRGEVLMREWGVREMGVGEPQAYRYKFV